MHSAAFGYGISTSVVSEARYTRSLKTKETRATGRVFENARVIVDDGSIPNGVVSPSNFHSLLILF